jgi:hypothetical protein
MRIDLLYVPDCPNRRVARRHIRRALSATGLWAVVRECEVRTREEAAQLGMHGSPTILIDGRDAFEETSGPADLACRLYPGPAGSRGVPTVDQLIAALVR